MKSRAIRRKLRRMRIQRMGPPKPDDVYILNLPKANIRNVMRVCKLLGEMWPDSNNRVFVNVGEIRIRQATFAEKQELG